ncbi:MAG: hypothetical protein HY886_10855 [Deltaproteobacteria bacterium]|nr:hypothetical protein [Deltaproteobacteria bacterium]
MITVKDSRRISLKKPHGRIISKRIKDFVINYDSDGYICSMEMDFIEAISTIKGRLHKIKKLNWDTLYGLGKGLWKEDAQEYIKRLRDERI